MKDSIAGLAEQIAWLDADGVWDLAKLLIEDYKIPANLLKADLDVVEHRDLGAAFSNTNGLQRQFD